MFVSTRSTKNIKVSHPLVVLVFELHTRVIPKMSFFRYRGSSFSKVRGCQRTKNVCLDETRRPRYSVWKQKWRPYSNPNL